MPLEARAMDCTLVTMPPAAGTSGRGFGAVMRFSRTIRGRILVAFLVMAVIAGALGAYAVDRIREVGDLAAQTFDRSVLSVEQARAAAADFTAMQNALIRCAVERDPDEVARLHAKVDELHTSLGEDLSIAMDRAQSDRAGKAGRGAAAALARWNDARTALAGQHRQGDWRSLDALAADVDQQIDLLANFTKDDGFLHRQKVHAIVAADIRTTLAGTALALAAAAAVAWLLARRIMGPVAAASSAADEIARGKLDGAIPPGSADELGALLSSMAAMRDNLRGMMEREVAQRRSAQARLADALESSAEGIVVVDADGRIALANSQLADFLAVSPRVLQPGASVKDLAALIDAPSLSRSGDARRSDEEARLADGRWLRVSRSATQEGGFVAVLSDVTVLKTQEEKLRATNFSLDAALENMSQGLCLYGADGRLMVVNRRFADIYALDAAAVRPGLAFDDVIRLKIAAGGHGAIEPDAFLRQRKEMLRGPHATVYEEAVHGRTVAIVRHPMAQGGWVATYEDVTEQRQAERQVLFMARHDALTQLPNRMLFGERIDDALRRLGRGEGFAVLCLDLDRFKQVNDTLGHPAGDELLRQVAERLGACVREVDTVGRLGGDEFAVVQCGIANEADTVALADRIIEAVGRPIGIGGRQVSVGVSVGIAMAPRDGTSRTKLLKSADAALYRAKGDGGGVWRCFEPEMDARMQARSALELDLQRALAEDQFEVFYQPLFDVARDRIGGFEALLRWRHPSRGMVSPAEFISVAEEMGLIVPLGEWVLARACAEACSWPDHVKVAVNVSPAQFRSSRLFAATSEALAASGLSSSRLELEITESVLLSDGAATLETLHSLRGAGVRFALDDFGTGYSSLNYLLSFPFDKIKIDRSFIRDLTTRREAAAIVRAVSQLATDLGMRITAEGVETRDQLDRLRRDGCDEIQGYYFSRPVPASEVAGLLLRWDAVQA